MDATPGLGGTPESGTGIALDPARTVAAWAWLRQHRPDALTAGGWLGITDYPLVAWTGIRFITDNLASRSAAWSPWTREWLPSRIAPTLGDAGRLPPVLRAGSIVGPIAVPGLRDVLTSNAVAVSAGHDHPVGGRVVDQVATGAVLDSMGTAEVVVCQVRRMPSSKPADIDVSPGITQPGATLLGVHELTRNLAWIKESRPVLAPYIDELLMTPTRRPMEEGDVFTVGRQGGESPGWHPGSWQLPPKAMAFAALMACARASAPTIERLMHLGGGSRVMAAGGGPGRRDGCR